MSRVEVAALVGLLALAAVLRMAWPGLTEFKADEGRLLTLALEMSEGTFAVRGISSSVGLPNFPMSVWLYALPLVVWRHPYAATVFTGLLATLAVGGAYWLARRYWGPAAALAATVLYVVGPWAIIFSRKIWAQNLLPVFVVGWAIGAALAFVDGRRPFVVLHLLCLAIAVQIHPAAIGLIPATLAFLVVFRRRLDWRMLLLGAGLALLTALPYLWYVWGEWRAAGRLSFSTGQAAGELSLDSLRLTALIALGRDIHALAGEGFESFLARVPGLTLVHVLWAALMLAGGGWLVAQVARRWERPATQVGFILLVWLVTPALVFLWHRTPVYIHYFIAVLPAPYLIAGAFFARLLAAGRGRARAAAWSALLLTAAWQLYAWLALLSFVGSQPLVGGFGVPLATKLAAADAARALLAETGAREVLVVGDGSLPDEDDFPAEYRALLHGTPHRYVDINREAVFPSDAAVVLLEDGVGEGAASVRPIYVAAASRSTPVDGPGGVTRYTVLALPPAAAPEPDVALEPPALLANWVTLTGHNDLRAAEGEAVWDLFWRPADAPDPAAYHWFSHLLNAGGERVAQTDVAAFAGDQWRAGDTVISRFVLPLNAGSGRPTAMRTGMYRFPSLESVPVLDEAANPAGDWLDLPLGPTRP